METPGYFGLPPPPPLDYQGNQGAYDESYPEMVPFEGSSQPHFITGSLDGKKTASMNSLLLCGNNADDNSDSVTPPQPQDGEDVPMENIGKKHRILKASFGKNI